MLKSNSCVRGIIKMSKSNEIEIELTVYIEECLRLRTQLEQVLVEKTAIEQ